MTDLEHKHSNPAWREDRVFWLIQSVLLLLNISYVAWVAHLWGLW